jgi:RNA:NAD 2'-phosphotransferase (TPT1/KptA family)
MMHSLEEAIDAIYLRTLEIPAPTYIQGYKNKRFTLKKFPPGHRDFLKLTPYLRRREAIIEGKIGNAVVKVIDAVKLFEVGLEVLKENPMFFICQNINCNSCNWSQKLYRDENIDLGIYEGTGCVDSNCEICVI